jgi:hypothetical protein
LVGIVLGVALNMTIAPFLDELCDPAAPKEAENSIQLRETKMVHEQEVKNESPVKNDESEGNDFYIRKCFI